MAAEVTKNMIPACGRPLHLGMLYDRCNDTLIPGITLWDPEMMQKHMHVKPQPSTECRIFASDENDHLDSVFSPNVQLQASLLGGKDELRGSAIFLKKKRKSKNHVQIVFYYSITTQYKELFINQLKTQGFAYSGNATDVITAVYYGAQAVFVFDREVASSENPEDIKRELQGVVQAFASSQEVMGGDGTAHIHREGRTNLEKFNCTFYGDVILENNPVTDSDAIRIYSSLPKLLGENGEKAVPIKVWLHPLAELDQRAVQLVHEISDCLIKNILDIRRELSDCEMQCQDLVRTVNKTGFLMLAEKLLHFQDLCKQYREAFQKQLAGILPSIRRGKLDEKVLTDILVRKEQSPFNSKSLMDFLKKKSKEIESVLSCCTLLKDDAEIISSESKLEEVLFFNKFVVSFTFTSLRKEEPYLLDLKEWICKTPDQASTSSLYEQLQSTEWSKEEAIIKKIREYKKSFSDFARLHKQNRKIKFIVSSVPDENHPGVSLYLYENGELISCNFGPLMKPLPPGIGEIRHDSVQLTFDHAEGGRALISSYHLEFRVFGQETWTALDTKNTRETFVVTKLLPNTRYQFRYAVRSKVGLGMSSRESEEVKTLPTSPPRKPRVTIVESSAVSLTWKSPKVIGEGAVIAEYKVKCQEDTERSTAWNDNWRNVAVGKGRLSCRVTGLRSGIRHKIHVLAVCSDGAESAPSLETIIRTECDYPAHLDPVMFRSSHGSRACAWWAKVLRWVKHFCPCFSQWEPVESRFIAM